MKFNNCPTINGQSYSILEFLQPEFYNELQIEKYTDDLLSKMPLLRDQVWSPKKRTPKNTQFEEDTIVQLLKSRWTRKQLQELYPIGDHTIADIRKRHAEVLVGLANPDKKQSKLVKNTKRRVQYKEVADAKRVLKV